MFIFWVIIFIHIIYSSKKNFPEARENEYYISDLIGCKIILKKNNKPGEVTGVKNFGAGDLLEVKFDNKFVLIPFNKENNISVNDLILPIFVTEGKNKVQEIKSMPGI